MLRALHKRCEKNMPEVNTNIIPKAYPVNLQVIQKWSLHIYMHERPPPPKKKIDPWESKLTDLKKQDKYHVCKEQFLHGTCSVVGSKRLDKKAPSANKSLVVKSYK